jgi:hypothetical protein
LTDKVKRSELINSPDQYQEAEVLREGVVKGAIVKELDEL